MCNKDRFIKGIECGTKTDIYLSRARSEVISLKPTEFASVVSFILFQKMDNDMTNNIEDHSRTIIHIDFDCFYAQVEMIKKPSLCNVPLGIQQKNIVVTSNYIAREYGVTKCMLVKDAKEVCPTLVLVKGEDLYDYRKVSYEATVFLQQYSPLVERLGLDENFVDVSDLVNNRLHGNINDIKVQGHIFGEASEICRCGCRERLKMGSVIAQEIRDGIKNELKLTTCAGIAHNKLLAKLVGSVHKPNQQTTIFPNSAFELMLSLKDISSIPGVGVATTEILDGLNIKTVENLHKCNLEKLNLGLTNERAKWLLELSYGKDTSVVKPSGKPQSIGLEDSCKSISVETEIKEKFHQLLTRLIILVSEDGRVPTTIKVTIRKFDSVNKISHRETRQCNISHSLFTMDKSTNSMHLCEQSENKLLSIIMHLFNKLVDISQSYHITLLGLSFTKFQERVSGRNSIASYFVKDVAVQSITSIESTETTQNFRQNLPTTSQSCCNTDGSETEMEPSPKKSRFTGLIARRKHFNDPEYSSPSKLRVADLRLNSRDGDQSNLELCNLDGVNGNNSQNIDTNQNIQCPPNADEEIFRELPIDVQQELWNEWKRERGRESDATNKPHKKAKTNTLLNYFVKN